MSRVRNMRLLRLKYKISLKEFAEVSGFSHQRLSQLELSEEYSNENMNIKMANAFFTLLEKREQNLISFKEDLY